MLFKTKDLEVQFQTRIDPKLRSLLEGLDAYCVNNGFAELMITELIRPPRHASDQHADGKAADVRAHVESECGTCHVGKYRYSPEELAMMRMYVETHHPRKWWSNKFGQQLSGFYPHGRGAVFHIHLSVD